MDITVTLKDESSLPALLAGQRVARFWLHDNGDGTYALQADALENAVNEAWSRALFQPESMEGRPPEPKPSEEVAEHMTRIHRWLDDLDAQQENQ